MPTMAEIETMVIGPPKVDRDDDDTGVSKRGVGGKKPRNGGSGVVERRVISLDDDDNDDNDHQLDEDAEEGEAALVVNRPRMGDDDDDDNEADSSINEDAYQLFLAYQKNRDLYAGDVYAKLHEIYESYSTEAEVIYAKKNLLPQIMFKLRVFVNKNMEETGEWNFQWLQRTANIKGSFKESTTFNMSTTLSMRDRLNTEPNILVYSFNDLVCLAYTLKYEKEALKQAQKRGSDDVVTKLIGAVERTIQKTIDEKLRPLDGTLAALKATNLLFAGEPIGLAVEKFAKIVENYGDRKDRGHVAIYFDFDKTKLYTIIAKDIEVPNAAALDAQFSEMRRHPRKLILLDLRKQYKARRGWM